MMPEQKTVFVGLSGGVDSSVSAALLKDQGYHVVGVFIRTWQPEWIECTWRDERRDAMRVAAHLDIPFLECDMEERYKKGVADYMINEYRAGRTPNPDVMCNREVKFGGFLAWALERGADYVATGHYAQNIFNTESGYYELCRGVDSGKDQSYFLWTLTQEQLKYILFPVGHLPKSETRVLAEKYQLPTARKKDSQGICFIGNIDMKEFLSHYISLQPGDVLDESGNIIGHHDGALFFTLGERHGFTITNKGTHDGRYYVVAKDVERNVITVSQEPAAARSAAADGQEIFVSSLNIIGEPLLPGRTYDAQIRYHGEIKKMTLSGINGDDARVILASSDPTISPGQSLVMYNGDICIGGGIIDVA